MDLQLVSHPKQYTDVKSDMLAIGVLHAKEFKLPKKLESLDKLLNGGLSKLIEREEFSGKDGQIAFINTLGLLQSQFLVLFGLGEEESLSSDTFRRYAGKIKQLASSKKATSLFISSELNAEKSKQYISAVSEGILLSDYTFDKYLTQDKPKATLETVYIAVISVNKEAKETLLAATMIANGVNKARDLVNEIPATLTPKAMAKEAQAEGKKAKIHVEIFDEKDLEKEKMGLMLGVGKGAKDSAPARMIRMSYTPKKKAKKHIVLVGKGVMFDSGGLDLKPADGMLDMKVDMAGAAAVAGTMMAIGHIKPDIAVTGYMGCVENTIGPDAYHPGDILVSKKGLTVEINNTDAEGRLVLADVLTYAQQRDKPDYVIDLATLTGAAMVALGTSTAAVFSNENTLAQKIREHGKNQGEDFWHMPLNNILFDQLKSNIADMKNTGSRWGGCITAALFLQKFIEDGVQWAHLDIAGPATMEKDHPYTPKGGAGFAVRTLVEFIQTLS